MPVGEAFATHIQQFQNFDPQYAIAEIQRAEDGDLLITPYFTALLRISPAGEQGEHFELLPGNFAEKLNPWPESLISASSPNAPVGLSDPAAIRRAFDAAISVLTPEIVGPLLAGDVFYNTETSRYEMFYTNLGFYMKVDGSIHLLPYGAWAHAGSLVCAQNPEFGLPPHRFNVIDAERIMRARAGDLDQGVPGSFLGFEEGETYFEEALGLYLKPYTTGVLTIDPNNSDYVGMLNIYWALGYPAGQMEPRNPDPAYLFYEIRDGLGYNIRLDTYNWVYLHAGEELSGKPVMSTYHYTDGDIDCFEAYCVIAYPDGRIVALDLGRKYQDQFAPKPTPTPLPTATPTPAPTSTPPPVVISTAPAERLLINSWDTSKSVPFGVSLRIYGSIFTASMRPVQAAPLYVVLYLPDGAEQRHDLPPTDAQGLTYLELAQFTADNGDVVRYDMCLTTVNGYDYCTTWFFTYRKDR